MKPTLMITHFKEKTKRGNETDFRLKKHLIIYIFYIKVKLDCQGFITDEI